MIFFEHLRKMITEFIHSKLQDPDSRDDIISYCSGHILTSTFVLGAMAESLLLSSLKILLALVIGVIGGVGGLLGKDIYEWGKKKIKKKKK